MKYEYAGLHNRIRSCEIEICDNLVVICEENSSDNSSTITNVVEKVATKIANENKIPLLDLIWVEHRAADVTQGREECYLRAYFKYIDGELVLPRYRHITKEQFDALKANQN